MREKKLLVQIKNGNIDAMNELLEGVYPKLYRFVFSLCHGEDIAKDITQETCIRFMKNLDHYQEQQQLHSYFCKIAMNLTRDYYRKHKRFGEVYFEEEQYIDEAKDPQSLWHQQYQEEELMAMIETLPLEQKEVLLLRFYYHFKIQEIADIYQVSPSTIKSRLKLGLEKMKKKVGGQHHE